MCCFVRCYFANTKIDESFRTAKIRRTFFGNSLASKFAGCVRKDDSGTGRLRAAPEKLRFESRRKQKSRPSGTQIVFFTIFRVVTTLLSVGRFCKAICNSVLEQAHFFPIFVLQSAAAGCLDCTRNLVNFRKQSSAYPALRCSLRRMARDMISYVITARAICAYCFQGLPEPRVE